MAEFELPAPLRGVSDDQAFTGQAPLTTPEAINARVVDGVTGRVRRSRRIGLERLSSTTVNGADVVPKRMAQVTYDARKTTYTGLTPTTTEDVVKSALPQKKPCYAQAIDKQGNIYVVDGLSTVVKYNSTGQRQWSFALPVADPQHLVRALDVDEFGIVYAGTSSGGSRDDKGRLWGLVQQPEDVVEILWEIETDSFVEVVKHYKGRLVALFNKPSTGQSWVVIYDGVTTGAPEEAKREVASFPANGLCVTSTGLIFVVANEVQTTAFAPASPRGCDPRLPAGKITVDWTIKDLLDVDTRVWREHHPGIFLTQDTADGDDVAVVPDTSGNGRDLFQKPGAGAPILKRDSLGRLPALVFGGSTVTPPPILTTNPNSSTNYGFRDRQQTFLPAYQEATGAVGYADNAQTVVFLLVSTENALVNGKGMGFFKQDAQGGRSHFIAFNLASTSQDLTACTPTAGRVRYKHGTLTTESINNGSGGGAVGQVRIAAGTWPVSLTNAVLITIVLNHGSTKAGTDHPSQFLVNGTVVDEFDLVADNAATPYLAGTFNPSEIGSLDFGAAALESFRGALHYALVLDRSRTNTNNAPLTYPFTQNAGTAQFAPDTTGDSERERIEGAICHEFGCADILPAGHPFSAAKGPPNRNGIASHSLPWLLNQNWQTLAAYSPAGELKAVLSTYAAYRAFAAQSIGGLGYGISADSDGSLYTMGPHALTTHGAPANDYTLLRKILYDGTSFTFVAAQTVLNGVSATPGSAAGAWSKTYNDITEQTGAPVNNVDIATAYKYPRPANDALDAIYFPWSQTTGAFTGVAAVAWDKTGGNGLTANRALTGNNGLILNFSQRGYVATPDPNVPTYDSTTLAGSNQDAKPRAEFVWFATDLGTGGTTSNETVHKLRFVQASRTTGSPRQLVTITVAGGRIMRGTTVLAAPAGSGTLAQPELSATADFIDMCVAFGKVYMTDGVTYVVYDPKTDTAKRWEAKKGRIPLRCKFIEFWRGRIVLARSADDGHLWHMSALGDPDNWDLDPPSSTPTQAIDGTSSARIGRCPDIINQIFAVNDDVLVFGCDHSIQRLNGDPQAGGEFDLVSDTIGMSFGKGRALDPAGNVSFFGSRGGVYRMAPQGFPDRISKDIDRRLESVDLLTYNVGMEWDYEENGLRVFFFPFGQGGTLVTQWFWDARHGGWWPDTFGANGLRIQPTACLTSDGDQPGDRVLIVACEDGFLRKFSRSATKDDQTAAGVDVPIPWGITHWPVWTAAGQQGRITSVTVELSKTQGECQVDLYASNTADDRGAPRDSFYAGRGRNPKRHVRAKGSYAGIRVGGVTPSAPCAIERVAFEAFPAGKHQPS